MGECGRDYYIGVVVGVGLCVCGVGVEGVPRGACGVELAPPGGGEVQQHTVLSGMAEHTVRTVGRSVLDCCLVHPAATEENKVLPFLWYITKLINCDILL